MSRVHACFCDINYPINATPNSPNPEINFPREILYHFPSKRIGFSSQLHTYAFFIDL